MLKVLFAGAALALAAGVAMAQALVRQPQTPDKPPAATTAEPNAGDLFQPEHVDSEGVATIRGQVIPYHTVAGTIVVHPKGWDDAARREKSPDGKELGTGGNPEAEASMFYVAYFKKGAPSADRPVTFIYNGGPGSSTMWLHARSLWATEGHG